MSYTVTVVDTEGNETTFQSGADEYILENNLKIDSDLMVAQYNSPWAIPPFRKNELIYKIK